MLIEEISKSFKKAKTEHFSLDNNAVLESIGNNLFQEDDGIETKKNRVKLNYNVNHLMNAQIQANGKDRENGITKSAQQVAFEKLVQRRLNDLNKECHKKSIDPLKDFFNNIQSLNKDQKRLLRTENKNSTKKKITERRTFAVYFEEEKNLVHINNILNYNYQFIDMDTSLDFEKKKTRVFKLNLKLCCICGEVSNYARCLNCSFYFCSVKCNLLHQSTRCKNF